MLPDTLRKLDWRLIPVQAGIVMTFALIPVWYRLSMTPVVFVDLYFVRFLILLPAVWSIGWWLVVGLPGFATFRRDKRRAGWALALLALVIWMYASQEWAYVRYRHSEVTLNAMLQFGVVVLFAVTAACAAPPARVIVTVLVLSLAWNTLITVAQTGNQASVGLGVLGEFSIDVHNEAVSVIESGDIRWLRPYGLLPHPNILAGVFVVGLLAAVVWITSRRRLWQVVGILVFLPGLWGLLLTFSRGAWMGFAAGAFAIYPLLRRHSLRHRGALFSLWLTVGLALCVGGAFVLMYGPLIAARAGVGTESIELRSVSDRVVFTGFAVRSVTERPLLGVGPGNFPWRTVYYLRSTEYDLRGDNVHQVFLSALAETGLVGYGLMVGALIFGIEAVLVGIKRNDHDPGARIALLGGVLGLAVIGLVDHYPWTLIQFQIAWWGLLAAAIKDQPPVSGSGGGGTTGSSIQAPSALTTPD